MGESGGDMKKADKELKFPCLSVRQGKYDLVCFVAKARTVWEFVQVNRRETDKDVGYQRALSPSRVEAVKRYIANGNAIPNSVLISLGNDSKISADKQKITIPNQEDAGWVIDGQHRLAGAHRSNKDIEVVVVAFIGLPEVEQINQFVTINREAKGVPTSLYYDLLKHLPPGKSDTDAAKERATDIATALRKNDSSPFYQRIVIDAPKKGQMSLTNFVRKVSSLVVDKKGKFHTYTLTEQQSIVDNYFRAMEHVFPKTFQEKEMTFFKTLGFGAAINALPTVFDLSLREYQGFRVEDAAKILKKVDYFDFSKWENFGTGTAAELQAGEDFRQELLNSFSDASDAGTLRL